ncbi:MAG: ATP-binding protein [Kiritimatiellae bacterium]|nr:ATP-binding protein [Kiritimatiellia bacterium]
MYSRINRINVNSSWFVFGPRGTGKTFWLRHTFPDAVYVDLLEARTCTQLLADPQRLGERIAPGSSGPVIIDEIQRAPALLDEVHRLSEARGLRFLLTGSSPRKLRRAGTNLLAGRALTHQFFPLTAAELGEDFDLERAVRIGMLPTLYDPEKQVDPDAYLASYVQTYLREEIVAEGLTRQAGAFARFLEAASFSQAQVLNVSEIARECSVHRKLVESYFGILEDLLIGIRLPVFERHAKRRLTHHPKFYLFDAGVYRAARPRGPLDAPEQIDGAALETLAFQELRAVNHNLGLDYTLHYWRTPGGMEVDFVLYGPRGIVAFEVKRSRRIRGHDLRGLRAFIADYPMAKGYILYGGEQRRHFDGVTAIPVGDALLSLAELL